MDTNMQTTAPAAARLDSPARQLALILLPDVGLTPDQLEERHGGDGDGEHPVFVVNAWIRAVYRRQTRAGYWSWVMHSINCAFD